MDIFPWPAIGSFLAGIVSISFLGYLWPYRHKTGASLFIGVIGCVTLWTLSYGVALLVFDPTLRFLFEIPIWLGINFTSLLFLAFALEYTGRKEAVRSRAMAGLAAIQLAGVGLIATNPRHELVWSDYRLDPVFGVATVSHTNEPWLFIIMLVGMIITAAGVLVLVDTFVSYGPLYRYQTLALALSPVPVLPGLLIWLFQVGPVPQLSLAPLLFPLHLALDMYAFFRRNMFELTPAARRAGDQTAIDDLGIGVIIVDDEGRVINLNQQTTAIYDREKRELLGSSLADLETEIELDVRDQRIQIRRGQRTLEYAVTVSALEDSGGNEVGHTITLQDITADRQREQRLAVLNRVLRHNLRNELNVATGYLELAHEQADSDELREMLTVAERNTEHVLRLGEKAHAVEQSLDTDELEYAPVELAPLLAELTAEITEQYDGDIELAVPPGLCVETDRQLLERICENLLENALEHGGKTPQVRVSAGVTSEVDLTSRTPVRTETAWIEIRDTGPGIPAHELSVIEQGEETDLEHGSGIGLWLVEWASTALGGEVSYETDDTGTTARLTLPGVHEPTPTNQE